MLCRLKSFLQQVEVVKAGVERLDQPICMRSPWLSINPSSTFPPLHCTRYLMEMLALCSVPLPVWVAFHLVFLYHASISVVVV